MEMDLPSSPRVASGRVVDIRTGRAIARTSSLTNTFIAHVQHLVEQDQDFYLVYGRCRHQEIRVLIEDLRETLNSLEIIYDSRMPSDTVWIFDGLPEELGFAV
jgi:hypothetical protein